MTVPGAFPLRPFPEWEHRVKAVFTCRSAPGIPGAGTGAYSRLNLGFRCGDDPEKVSRNWAAVLHSLGLNGKTLVLPAMVHGNAMADADALPGDGKPEPAGFPRLEPQAADAVCSRSAAKVLAVTMADCLTALVFDPVLGTVAAVHAGWRGTRAGILEKSLRTLMDTGRIRADSALVALGPCLRRDSLEVGPEVAAQLDPAFLTTRSGKSYFDMPACNRAQALACGILAENIRDTGGCTLTEPERYFSYRRDGQASGRMAALISLARD